MENCPLTRQPVSHFCLGSFLSCVFLYVMHFFCFLFISSLMQLSVPDNFLCLLPSNWAAIEPKVLRVSKRRKTNRGGARARRIEKESYSSYTTSALEDVKVGQWCYAAAPVVTLESPVPPLSLFPILLFVHTHTLSLSMSLSLSLSLSSSYVPHTSFQCTYYLPDNFSTRNTISLIRRDWTISKLVLPVLLSCPGILTFCSMT